mgnify:CR=1 FL=1
MSVTNNKEARIFVKKRFDLTMELGEGDELLARRIGKELKKTENCLYRVTVNRTFGETVLWTRAGVSNARTIGKNS